jgi:GH15 family glucan-1,4-alpha-glucosidase
MAYQPIENYGIIGNLQTTAHIGMDGSIDFMCFPHFDSPSIFCALIDAEKGGRFKLAPVMQEARQRQLYLPDSCVLLTRFLSTEGVAEVSDFMPIADSDHAASLVRRAKTVRGQVRYRMHFEPRFDYARASHHVELIHGDREALFQSEGKDELVLRLYSQVPLRIVDGAAVADFTLNHGESAAFIMEEATEESNGSSRCRADHYVSDAFKETLNFWRHWVGRCAYKGRWREIVNRSALTLKLLTSKPYGSLVAAPTFGIPEDIGGERNWDYRYTWIRDASFSLYALIRLGYTDEAAAFMKWIEARCNELEPDGSLQIMYGINGRHALPEEILSHLSGYLNSKPVRVGNAAYQQLQLDIYGELMDSVYLYDKFADPISYDLWCNLLRLLNWVAANWRRPDNGIWEGRAGPQEFLYSRFMCWVALDRGVRLAHKRALPAPLDKWIKERDDMYREIFTQFWNPDLNSFVAYKGSRTLDAANLLMPLIRFIGPTDPRWLATLRATEEYLLDDSLVYRYITGDQYTDGLLGREGTFCMCSFWYVECLSRAGDMHQARYLFEKMLGYANHLGLYAEELGSRGEHLGNFPQAFTHIGLISAAYHLDRSLTARGHA